VDEEAVDGPEAGGGVGVLVGADGGDPGEVLARAERAPADRLVADEGEDAVGAAGRDQLLEGALGRGAAGLLPERAAPLDPPPHAPAAGAGAARPEEL